MGAEQTIQSIELTQNYNTVKENIRKACETGWQIASGK